MENIFAPLHSKSVYDPSDQRIMALQKERFALLDEYNSMKRTLMEEREEKLRSMFHSFGSGSYIEIPFYANWAGLFVDIGEAVYANFNLTLVDDTFISIGDHTMIGPNVTIATATHPYEKELREKGLQKNMPVRIGKNCFIASGAIICPGVEIGDNTIVGAGSVVTRSLPADVVAYGNPCRVARSL